jgi:hypothetical protein
MIISSIIYCIFFEISLIEICKKNYWLLIMEKRRDIYSKRNAICIKFNENK